MNFDGIAFNLVAECIETVLELRLGQCDAGPLHEGFQQRPFATGQIDGAAVLLYRFGGKIDLEVAYFDQWIGIAAVASRDGIQS